MLASPTLAARRSGACSLEDLLSHLEVIRVDRLREVSLLDTESAQPEKEVRKDPKNVLHGASLERLARLLEGRSLQAPGLPRGLDAPGRRPAGSRPARETGDA